MTDRLQVKVTTKQVVAQDIAAFELAPLHGGPLPAFAAGSHIDVHLPGGLVRQYSLVDLPDPANRYRIGVLRDPASRGGSAALIDQVKVGDTLEISAPRNHFALAPAATQSLLFAGGIGITPILCMARELVRQGKAFDLHYCGRALTRMAFLDELRDGSFDDHVQVHADDGSPGQQLDARAAIGAPGPGRHLYVCGPTGFMDHVLGTARALGWPEAQLHREYFAAAPIDHSADGPFEVVLQRSGRVIAVGAAQSAAQALLDAGVDVMLSCEQGVCGTCITKVVGGTPDHRDMYFTDAEHARNDCFTPCCSRSRTPQLVLDL